MSERSSQLLVSGGVLAAGLALAAGTYFLPEAAGYAQVGPRLFPALIAAGLIVVGALLLKEAYGAGFRNPPDDPRGAFDALAFGWIAAGIVTHMVLISSIGFILASTLLFICAARGFGSRSLLRDAVIGLAISVVVFVIFTRGLTLQLPWGRWMPGA
jgi:putative tricarboxylic transport membrane protein